MDMGQFLPMSSGKLPKLPESLRSLKLSKFIKASFGLREVKRLLKGTGEIVNGKQ